MSDTFSTYHPLNNMLFFAGSIGVTVFVTHPFLLAISLAGCLSWSCLLKGFKKTLKFNLLFSLPMMIIVTLVNPLFNHYGVTILGYLYNGNPFTLESCVYGLVMAVMLCATLIWFSCYTEVMTSDKFIYLFGRIIPALSLVLSMSLRFVPRFANQSRIISDTQKSIGRSTDKGSLITRIKHGVTIFSILVTWALENAIETADSMKCRGYGEKGRTAFSIYRFDKRDRLCLLYMAAAFGLTIAGAVRGGAYASFNPRIRIGGAGDTLSAVMTFGGFAAFVMLPAILEVYDRVKWNHRRSLVEQQNIDTFRLWEV